MGLKRMPAAAGTVLAMLISVCSIAVAEPSQTRAPKVKGPLFPLDPVAQLVASEQLVLYAEANRDPLAFLMAARLQKDVGVTGASGKPAYIGLLARAREIVGQRADIVALAEEIATSSMRGTTSNGREKLAGVVPAGGSRFIQFEFVARKTTMAAVTPDRGAAGQVNLDELDVDLYVRDARGNLVCKSEGPGMPDACPWVPETQGKFTIELANRSRIPAPLILTIE